MIQKNDVVGYYTQGCIPKKGTRTCKQAPKNIKKNIFTRGKEVVLEDVLKMFAEKGRIELAKLPSKKRVNKIAVSDNLDKNSDEIICAVIKGDVKKLKQFPVEGKIIKPLYLFLDEEILLYVKIKKLKFKEKKTKQSTPQVYPETSPSEMSTRGKISKFVDELEKKHPEIKRAIINSWLELSI